MIRLLGVVFRSAAAALQSRRELALENLALRHQLSVLQAAPHRRLQLTHLDRAFWTILRCRWSEWKRTLVIVQPETVVRWHPQGFKLYWRWKSRAHGGRPRFDPQIQALVRQMSLANPLWGAPRIHGELLKLGIQISQTTVAKYMPRRRRPPSQTWRAFLDNHLKNLVSIDFFTVPSATFHILFVFVVLAHDRRRVLHFNVTEHPTAEWTAQQIVEAFPWDTAPQYLLRDRDAVYGTYFRHRVAGLGGTEVLIAPRAPWQNPYVERLIGSIRRECLDHVIGLGEAHLRRVLGAYIGYYHSSRTHLSLDKDAPEARDVQPPTMGEVIELPEVGGLHHRYERRAA
jgi:putative transposase